MFGKKFLGEPTDRSGWNRLYYRMEEWKTVFARYIKESEINQVIESLSEVMQMEIYGANNKKAIRFFAKNYSEAEMKKDFSAKVDNEKEFLDYIYQV